MKKLKVIGNYRRLNHLFGIESQVHFFILDFIYPYCARTERCAYGCHTRHKMGVNQSMSFLQQTNKNQGRLFLSLAGPQCWWSRHSQALLETPHAYVIFLRGTCLVAEVLADMKSVWDPVSDDGFRGMDERGQKWCGYPPEMTVTMLLTPP